MSDLLFRGVAPALITPFTPDDDVDLDAFRRLIDYQIDGGVAGLVVLGTTGENPTVTHEERRHLVDAAVDQADGRVPVIVGTGTNDTAESITFSQEAKDAGADGLLVVGPYYNKPSQDGFAAHVEAIADRVDLPIILYNVPGRTSFNISADTVLRLAEDVPQVAGVKEASGDLAQITNILNHRLDDFAVYAGDDEISLPLVTLGGDGCVSVISNALPGPFSSLVQSALDGDVRTARKKHFDLLGPMRACFFETNPVPVKIVCSALGYGSEHVRLPLVPVDTRAPARQRILAAFDAFIEVTA